MLIGIGDMTKFDPEETKDVDQEVHVGELETTAGRLMIPSHMAVDFVVISASVKHKDSDRESPIVSAGGTVSAVVFSETSFGLHGLNIRLSEGDIIKMKLRNTSKAPREFSAALDCWVREKNAPQVAAR